MFTERRVDRAQGLFRRRRRSRRRGSRSMKTLGVSCRVDNKKAGHLGTAAAWMNVGCDGGRCLVLFLLLLLLTLIVRCFGRLRLKRHGRQRRRRRSSRRWLLLDSLGLLRQRRGSVRRGPRVSPFAVALIVITTVLSKVEYQHKGCKRDIHRPRSWPGNASWRSTHST